jgi:hypothetical protein
MHTDTVDYVAVGRAVGIEVIRDAVKAIVAATTRDGLRMKSEVDGTMDAIARWTRPGVTSMCDTRDDCHCGSCFDGMYVEQKQLRVLREPAAVVSSSLVHSTHTQTTHDIV